MAKIRGIKPEFWSHSDLAELTPWARLFYIGLWNFSDDNGVFEWEPKRLKVLIFPYDAQDATKLLNELKNNGRILQFTLENKSYGYVNNFEKHQKPDKRFFREIINGFQKLKPTLHYVATTSTLRDHVADSEVDSEVDSDIPTEVQAAPGIPKKENVKITQMLAALKEMIGIDAFADVKIERFMGKHCVKLVDKIGAQEFRRRLTELLKDDFKRKNCNRIKYLYGELHAWIEPKPNARHTIIS